MKWNYGGMENVSQFSGYNDKLDESKIPANTNPDFFSKAGLKQFGKDQLANAAAGAINAVGRNCVKCNTRSYFRKCIWIKK